MRLPLIDGELLAQREVLPEQVATRYAGPAECADHESVPNTPGFVPMKIVRARVPDP